MGSRLKKRVGAPIQLVYGEDDDLIKWYGKLPKGQRQQTLKNMLRVALKMPLPAPVATVPTNAADVERVAMLETVIGQLQEQLGIQQQWIEYLYQNGGQGQVVATNDQPAPAELYQPVEQAKRVSDDKLTKREKRLKKQGW